MASGMTWLWSSCCFEPSYEAHSLSSPPVSPDLQLVIFDCDGVLVDSEVLSNHVLWPGLTAAL